MPKDLYANIAINIPINRLFTYKVPEYLTANIKIGKRVLVPFSQKILTGIVVSFSDFSDYEKTKDIKTVLDENEVLTDEMIKFSKWISDYYLAPFGEVLFSFIPAKTNIQSDVFYSLNENFPEYINRINVKENIYSEIINSFKNKLSTILTKKQIEKKFSIKDSSKYLEYLVSENVLMSSKLFSRPTPEKFVKYVSKNFKGIDIDGIVVEYKIKSEIQKNFLEELIKKNTYELSELIKTTGISTGSVNSLLKKGLIVIEEVKVVREHPEVYSEEYNKIELNAEQQKVFVEFKSALDKKEFAPFLLH
jgi:primosomal protein N' (replication factor Y) (superfamily II helicase)